MKDKILNSLKRDYAHLGLDETVLSGLASMLATSGLVTEDNLQSVIAGQKAYLEDMQRANDRRVQEAVQKTQRKADQAAATASAEHKEQLAKLQAQIDTLSTPPAPPAPDAKPDTTPSEMPAWYINERNERQKQLDQLQQTITTLQQAKSESDAKLLAIEQASQAEASRRAAAERTALIGTKAKQLGIPDWLIAHGFADIPSDADDAQIDQILTGYAHEIQTSLLPPKNPSPQFDGTKATKEEVNNIIDKILPKTK